MSELLPCPHHEKAIYPKLSVKYHDASEVTGWESGWWEVAYDCPECGWSFSDSGDTEEEVYEMAMQGWNERYERTCHMVFPNPKEPKCHCDACSLGYSIGDSVAWHGGRFIYLWSYCKNCGAKVVDDDCA